MNKKIIKITLTLGIILLPVCFSFIFNQDIYAGSVGNSGEGYKGDYGDCGIGETGSYACVGQYTHGSHKYGGVSWRYYEVDENQGPVEFQAKPNTGANKTVDGCNEVGGFYFLGFEAYNSTVGYRGFQIPSISISRAYERAYRIKPESGIPNNGNTASNDAALTGDIVSWEDAKEAFYEARDLGIITSSADFEESEIEWFCAKKLTDEEEEEEKPKPKTAEFQASSKVSIDGRDASVGYSSQPKSAAASTIKNWEQAGQKITIHFSHDLRKVGDAEKTSQYSIEFNGSETIKSGTTSSTYSHQYEKEVDIPEENSQATYCSKILFDNGLGQTGVKSEVCASIIVGEKSFNVTFVGDNNIYASETFEVTEDPGIGGLKPSPTGNYIIPAGTSLDGLNLKVVDKTIPLKFKNTITRIDNNSEVSKAGTMFYVTNPELTPSSTDLAGKSLQDLKDKAKDKAKGFAKYKIEEGKWFNTDLLDDTRMTPGETKTVHTGTLDMEVKSTEREVCQAITYLPSRLVDENGNSIVLKDSVNFIVELFKLTVCAMKNFFARVFGMDVESCQADLDAATQAGIEAALNLAEAVQKNFAQGLEGNYGLAYSCVTFQQALNFKLNPKIAVSDEVALVGETVSIDTNNSKIISTPLNEGTLTQTSPLEIETVVFQADKNSEHLTNNLPGTVDAGDTANTKEPCKYFEGITKRGTCKSITEFSHTSSPTDTKIINRGDGSKQIATFNDLFPGKTYQYPVGDLPTGSLICFATGVKDADSDSFNNGDGRWAISSAACRTVAKKPSFQVHDGSVYSAGSASADSAITSLTNKIPSGESSQKLFGSWVEYGLIGKADIINFTSGAKIRNGSTTLNICEGNNPFDTLSPLTIANKDCTLLGQSQISANPSISDRLKTTFTEIARSQASDSDDTINLSSATEKTFKNFSGPVSVFGTANYQHIIYAPDNLTITGDIRSNDINAQVILISDGDIIINNDVTQVDAWLIAENGSVLTCEKGISILSETSCGGQLRINGPVFASGLQPRRTFGSGVGNQSATPAEIFTLPASTYVWAHSYANTDKFFPSYQRELAPRL